MPKRVPKTKSDELLAFIRQAGIVRPRDLDALGIPREYLKRLCAKGLLERPSRGIYISADAKPTENQGLVQACKRVPQGIICLLSALQFHDLTTEAPFEVWMAIGEKTWRPKVDYPPLRFVRYSTATLASGVEEHHIDNATVRVFSVAKTVADCFKYRNKIGQDVALEALRECWKNRRATMDNLWQEAQVCRVANIMRPYLESLT